MRKREIPYPRRGKRREFRPQTSAANETEYQKGRCGKRDTKKDTSRDPDIVDRSDRTGDQK